MRTTRRTQMRTRESEHLHDVQHTNTAIEITDAAFAYTRDPVVTGVNTQLQPGQAMALIGPNGSGKTTWLRAVLGMVRVAEGQVQVLGHQPGHAPRGSIGYVPQVSDLDQTFPVTVRDVVQMGLYPKMSFWQRVNQRGRERVQTALKEVDLLHRADDKFGNLSGGQQQRVLVARCLASSPQLLLLDEPFNGLDQPNRDALLRIINSVKASGVAVAVSTHDLVLAREVCELICLLGNGHQVAFGSRDDIFGSQLLAQAYGGHDEYYAHQEVQ